MSRIVSSAIVLVALGATDAHALVESKCITPEGLLRGVIEILPDADTERRRPCLGSQSEILTQIVDLFPSQRALQLGLVPAGAAPIAIEGHAVPDATETVWIRRFPGPAPAPDEALGVVIDILDENNDESDGRGCALWFIVTGSYGYDGRIGFHNLDNQPQTFMFMDHSVADLPNLMDAQAAIIVGPAPDGQARASSTPIRFAMPDGTTFRFDDAQVSYNALGRPDCQGSVEVTVESAG
jgi:hypothetical protein